MTHNNQSVAENLRKTVRKLKDQLEAIKKFLKDTITDEVWSDWQVTDYAKEALKILEEEE